MRSGECSACGAPRAHDDIYDAEYRRNREILLATATVCAICGAGALENDPLTADHIIPVSDGGSNDLDNLRAAHRSCNSRRGNQPA